MEEFVSKNLIAITASLITGAITICGVLISSRTNLKIMQETNKQANYREEKKFKIEKIETILENFIIWENSCFSFLLPSLGYHSGSFSRKDFIEFINKEKNSKSGDAKDKVEMLIAIYLDNEAMKLFRKIEEIQDEVSTIGSHNEQNIKHAEELYKLFEERKKIADKLKDKLNNKIKELLVL